MTAVRLERISTIGDIADKRELEFLLGIGRPLVAFSGLVPTAHVPYTLCKTLVHNVNLLTSCGLHHTFLLADTFARGVRDTQKTREYGEHLKQTLCDNGLDATRVRFVWSSDVIKREPTRYLELVIDISTKIDTSRILDSTPDTADGRFSRPLFACMQIADIVFLDVDVCLMDESQRGINMLAREYCTLTRKARCPVVVSFAAARTCDLALGDTPETASKRITKMWCKQGETSGPLFDVIHCLYAVGRPLSGYAKIDDILTGYTAGDIHPGVLKKLTITAVTS